MLKFKTELAERIKLQLNDKKIQDIVSQIKEAGEDRAFKVIASTGAIDRDQEVIDPNGWQLSNFLKNPVILWAHNSRELPIGVATKVYVENKKLIVEGKFAPADANPFAEQVKKLYDEKIIKTVSVGFIGVEFETKKQNNMDIFVWTKAELLELSFVPVPANPEALSLMKSKGLDKDKLTEVKAEDKKLEKRVDRLEKIVVKHDDELKHIHKRIDKKYREVCQKLYKERGISTDPSEDDRENEQAKGRKQLDGESLEYLKDKKTILQDIARFANDALHNIKKDTK
jgi:HK97 family phage prohead protease